MKMPPGSPSAARRGWRRMRGSVGARRGSACFMGLGASGMPRGGGRVPTKVLSRGCARPSLRLTATRLAEWLLQKLPG